MATDYWVVKTLGGEEWGFVKRLIIDSATRQISHVDVILAETGRLIRIPWNNFEVQNEEIKLGIPAGQVNSRGVRPPEVRVAETAAMDQWP